MQGNKGAVAIRFRIFDSTVCIINSHLAAHKQNVQGRNEDYHNICKRIAFSRKWLYSLLSPELGLMKNDDSTSKHPGAQYQHSSASYLDFRS